MVFRNRDTPARARSINISWNTYMKLKTLVACVIIAGVSPALYAAEKKAGSGPNPFSDCGIGAALFPTIKPAAVTSNIIWDVGTTALTSATASPETCSGKPATVAKFILESYDNLAEETARGEGKHLDALLSMLEVKPSAQALVVADLRQQMSQKVSSPEYLNANKVDKSSAFYQSVMASLPSA